MAAVAAAALVPAGCGMRSSPAGGSCEAQVEEVRPALLFEGPIEDDVYVVTSVDLFALYMAIQRIEKLEEQFFQSSARTRKASGI